MNVSSELTDINGTMDDICSKLSGLDSIKTKMDEISGKLNYCVQSIVQLTATVTDISARVDAFDQRLSLIEKKPSPNSTLDSSISSSITAVTKRIHRMECENRDQELAITGLPDFPNNKITETIQIIAKVIGITYSSNDVSLATKISHSKGKHKPLIIRFTSTFIRDSWLAQKKLKQELFASEIFSNWPHTLVNINERSTTKERQILSEAKKFAQMNKYKFVWMKRGVTYLRKDENSHIERYAAVTECISRLNNPQPHQLTHMPLTAQQTGPMPNIQ